ncbi:lipoprotein, tandem type [Leptospira fletcheri]|uniref:Lipoprotein, tandem type n=1 Tax=Leptospira fletcheri TaxID=2484981 RepID=A0A4R9G4P8_9LEPT|nr:lipoprotein, tandem type [Leptospira fletcheri]TGK06321.1 lipoprotein, tandem type [Leptospira fletcheri]
MKALCNFIFSGLLLIFFLLITCKDSKESLELKKKESVANAINSTYQLGGNGLAFLVDRETAIRLRDECLSGGVPKSNSKSCIEYMNYWGETCFDFRPKEGRAIAKFYKHPEIYKIEVTIINELEYTLIFKGKKASLSLNLLGDFPVKKGSGNEFYADPILTIPNDSRSSGSIGRMDLIYGGEGIRNIRHARFNTLEECEAQNLADEEKNKQIQRDSEEQIRILDKEGVKVGEPRKN